MNMPNDIVKFQLPDGTEVSNDPRWVAEQGASAMEEYLKSVPNSGNMGTPDDELAVQLGHGEHPLQSGQEQEFDPSGGLSGAQLIQRDDRKAAEEAGFDPNNPEVNPETSDNNEAVLKLREQKEKAMAAALKAQQKLAKGKEEPGDPDKPYTEWSADQLKLELANVQAARADAGEEPLDTEGVKNKKQLAALLQSVKDAGSGDDGSSNPQ